MKRIYLLAAAAGCMMATPAFADSCGDLVDEINDAQTRPATTEFKSVMILGHMYTMGNLTGAQLHDACDQYDTFLEQMDADYQTKRRYISQCNGRLTLGDGTVIRDLGGLARNQEFLLHDAKRDHPEICAIANGEKPAPKGLFDFSDIKIPSDPAPKLDGTQPSPPDTPSPDNRRADIPPEPAGGSPSIPGRSYWTHNGSSLYLVANGKSRELYYDKPKPGMLAAGARPGSLLFSGTYANGRYSGTAYIFNKRCGTVAYDVAGPVSSDFTSVTMEGDAPSGLDSDCNPTRHVADTLQFSLCSKSDSGDAPSCP
jgi:hypothetical protein